MKRSVLVIVVCLVPSLTWAGGENNGRGVRAVSLANSFVALADDPWTLRHNAAGLAGISSTQGSVFFVPQQFGLEELKTVAAVATIPFSFGTIGAGIDQFGFSLYKEMTVSLGIGKRIDWGISGGLTVNLHRFSIQRYGSSQQATVDFGLLAEITDDARLGCSIKNIWGATIGVTKDPLPQVLHLGASISPVSGLRVVIEAEKDIRYPTIAKVGVEQILFDILALRVGASNNPEKFSGGFGIRYAMFEFGYAGYSHSFLGWTHQIEIGVRLD